MVTTVKTAPATKRSAAPAAKSAKTAKAPTAVKVAAPAKAAAKAKASTPAPKVKAEKSAKPAARSAATREPSMRFLYSQDLHERTESVLLALEANPSHSKHGEAVADLTTALIEAGMDYYFLRALKEAKVGFVTEQSARLGMSGAVRLISSISRKYIVRMNETQLLAVASHIRALR